MTAAKKTPQKTGVTYRNEVKPFVQSVAKQIESVCAAIKNGSGRLSALEARAFNSQINKHIRASFSGRSEAAKAERAAKRIVKEAERLKKLQAQRKKVDEKIAKLAAKKKTAA